MFSEEAKKDELIKKLEAQVQKLTLDLANEMERLNKEIENLITHNEFTVNNLNLQLEAANVKLREMHDFAMKKMAMEQELIAYVLPTNGMFSRNLTGTIIFLVTLGRSYIRNLVICSLRPLH